MQQGRWYKNSTIIAAIIGAVIGGFFTITAAYITIWIPGRSNKPDPKIMSGRQNDRDFTMLVGSGTVHTYLYNYAPNLIKDPKIRVLDGATDTAIRVISEAYIGSSSFNQGSFPILALSSRKLEKKDFTPFDENAGFFEIQIGEDWLQVSFGAPIERQFENTFQNSTSPQRKPIPNIGQEEISIKDLYRWLWSDSCQEWNSQDQISPYIVLLTTQGSATRYLFEKNLRAFNTSLFGSNNTVCWPADFRQYKLGYQALIHNKFPWIAIGSRIINSEEGKELQELENTKTVRVFRVLDPNGDPIKRGLFIYGRMPNEKRNVGKDKKGYVLDERISEFFVQLFSELEMTNPQIRRLLNRQRRFLHLSDTDSTNSWIDWDQPGGHSQIYRYRDKKDL